MSCQNNPDCEDKDSTHYFMCHMNQEDWEKRIGWSEMEKARELQYHFNMIRKPFNEFQQQRKTHKDMGNKDFVVERLDGVD